MNSTIDLTCTTAHNALLVPIQALKDEQSGKAIVYVLNSDGTYTEHSRGVGEKTLSMAEIKGDIKAGDRVVHQYDQIGFIRKLRNGEGGKISSSKR
jgi:multidrug efflux pump subunit AcrA (membrane-fusion protein)